MAFTSVPLAASGTNTRSNNCFKTGNRSIIAIAINGLVSAITRSIELVLVKIDFIMITMNNEQRLLNSKNAAFYLNIPEQTLRSSRVYGLIYGIKPPSFKKLGVEYFMR